MYQEGDGGREPLEARFTLGSSGQIGFEVEAHEPARRLVIDPEILFSGYLGGSGNEMATAVAVDEFGSIYLTGHTSSPNFPATSGAPVGGFDVFVTRLDPTANVVMYSTYLGSVGDDFSLGIAADEAGSAFVAGLAARADFPTMRSLQAFGGGTSDAFVAKIDRTGQLVLSTFVGGSGADDAEAIGLNLEGDVLFAGFTSSPNFPVPNGANTSLEGAGDGFVAKLRADGTALVYGTYLGGSAYDITTGLAVDASGNAWITGMTGSSDFPGCQRVAACIRPRV